MPSPIHRTAALPTNPNLRGAAWLALSGLLFIALASLTKDVAAAGLHAFEITFFRGLFGVLALTPFVFGPGGAGLATARPREYALRSAIGAVSMLAGFFAMTALPLGTAVALSFTKPLFALVLARLILGEALGWTRSMAAVIGFVGVLLVSTPELASGAGLAAGLSSALGAAIVAVIIRRLSATERPATLLFWFTVAITIVAAGPAWAVWRQPQAGELVYLATIGALATLSQYCAFQAYRVGEVGAITPIDYLQLIWGLLVGMLLFNEFPTVLGLAGTALVSAGALMAVTRRRS